MTLTDSLGNAIAGNQPALGADSTAEFAANWQNLTGFLSWYEIKVLEDVPTLTTGIPPETIRAEIGSGTYWGPENYETRVGGFLTNGETYEIVNIADGASRAWHRLIGTPNSDETVQGPNFISKDGTSTFNSVKVGDIFTVVTSGNKPAQVSTPFVPASFGTGTAVRNLNRKRMPFADIIRAVQSLNFIVYVGELQVRTEAIEKTDDMGQPIIVNGRPQVHPVQATLNVLTENSESVKSSHIKNALVRAGFRTSLEAGDGLETVFVTKKHF